MPQRAFLAVSVLHKYASSYVVYLDQFQKLSAN